jgi:hypothetical protein
MVLLLEPEYGSAGTNLLAPATQKRILADCPRRVDADSLWGYYEHDFQKSWKDKDGNWQDQSISLKSREILAVQKALDEAFVESYGAEDDE